MQSQHEDQKSHAGTESPEKAAWQFLLLHVHRTIQFWNTSTQYNTTQQSMHNFLALLRDTTRHNTERTVFGDGSETVRPSGCADSFHFSLQNWNFLLPWSRTAKTVRAPAWTDSFAAIASTSAATEDTHASICLSFGFRQPRIRLFSLQAWSAFGDPSRPPCTCKCNCSTFTVKAHKLANLTNDCWTTANLFKRK